MARKGQGYVPLKKAQMYILPLCPGDICVLCLFEDLAKFLTVSFLAENIAVIATPEE